MKTKKIALLIAAAGVSAPVFATNGMNQAGYGPIAESMGGASMAYDNGVAGAINNPATLGFMASGTSRLDVGFGDLRPLATANGQGSTAKDFYMPGLGYIRKDGNIAWGVAVMAQGGMGTDYTNGNFWNPIKGFGGFGAGVDTSGANLRNMSEVGVGRVMFPLAFNVNQDLTIGGSIDYVWAGMDIKWLVDGAHFADMMPTTVNPGATNTFGTTTGSLVNTFGGFMGGTPGKISGISWGYFDFEKGGHFSQAATATGWAGNLGFTYKVSPKLTIGGVYHAKTSLSDMTTSSNGATLSMNAAVVGAGNLNVPIVGKVTVKNFQWPETWGLGLSYQVNDTWQVAADYKRINWSGVMKNFVMAFDAAPAASQTGMAQALVAAGGTHMDLTYFQNWKDQNVIQLGAAYKYSDALTIRFGANIGDNPIPDQFVSPLFPAIMKDHYMVGFGYAFSKASTLDAGFVYAPKVSVTNNWSAVGGGSNQNISLGSDLSYQLMYSHRF